MAELFLVRHAQASFHGADYDQLSALGRRQSHWLGEYFAARGLVFDAHITGTLRRHQQTLDGIGSAMGSCAAVMRVRIAGLDEYDFRGLVRTFAGNNRARPEVVAWEASPDDKSAFHRVLRLAIAEWASGALQGELTESWSAFRARVEHAAAELQALAARHRRLLAISSGGAMAALLGGRLDLAVPHIVDLNMQVRNTSVSHFFLNAERFLLSSWNAVPHLEGAGRGDAITYG